MLQHFIWDVGAYDTLYDSEAEWNTAVLSAEGDGCVEVQYLPALPQLCLSNVCVNVVAT